MRPCFEHPMVIRSKSGAMVTILKIIFCFILAPILIPLKILLIGFAMYSSGCLFFLVNIGTTYPEELSNIRWKMMGYAAKYYGYCAMWVTGFFVHVKCRENLYKTPVIVSNHRSFFDAAIAPLICPMKCTIKASAGNFWPMYHFNKLNRAFMVSNGDWLKPHVKELLKDAPLTKQMQLHVERFGSARPVLVFPEGTVSADQIVLKFRTSAFRISDSVTPVSIRYHSLINAAWVSQVWWVAGIELGINLGGYVSVVVHPPMEREQSETVEAFAERVEGLIAHSAGAEPTAYTGEDQLWFWGVPGKKPSQRYLDDFGWMDTMDEFCKKHNLWQAIGLREGRLRRLQKKIDKQE